jgi:TonB family protein
MMQPLWLANLGSYCVQVATLVAAGGLAAGLLRLRQPRVMLAYWQTLLAACLLLPLIQPWHQMALAPAGGAATATVRTGPVVLGSPAFLFPLQTWILLVLVAGGVLGLLRLALGLFRLSHYRRTALRITAFPGALHEAQALVGVQPRFYSSERVSVPVTFGWLDPVVILPATFAQMDESHQRAIACHELLHVARRDWLLNLLEELVLTLFWFHPAIWWTIRNIRLGREQVVDREVVALTGARKPYLHALLEIAGAARAMPVPAPLFLLESQLARRVATLMKEVRMSKPRLIASLVIALAVLVAAGWWAVKTFRLTAQAELPAEVLFGYGHSSAPGSDGTSAFMFYMVQVDQDTGQTHSGYGGPRLYKEGSDIKGPVPISMPDPPYTPQARKDKVQGAIVAAVEVDTSGNVAGVKLTAVSLSRDLSDGLDESVMQTVRTWKFKPAMKKGKPVPVMVTVQVNFSLS